jgi:hypothetical protein
MNTDAPKIITAVYVSGSISLDPADPAWAGSPEATIDFSRRLNESGARTTFEQDEIRHAKVKAVHNGTDIFSSINGMLLQKIIQ